MSTAGGSGSATGGGGGGTAGGSAATAGNNRHNLLQGFSFKVEVTGGGSVQPATGFFREFSGASLEVSPIQYKTFNVNTGMPTTMQVAGRTDPGTVTLKRGLMPDLKMLKWASLVTQGKLMDARATVTITLQDRQYRPRITVTLQNAWPSKFQMGSMNVETNEIQAEELTIVYEQMQIAEVAVPA
jgi:phage tail-like protein